MRVIRWARVVDVPVYRLNSCAERGGKVGRVAFLSTGFGRVGQDGNHVHCKDERNREPAAIHVT